ncbi:MAG: hypothetical protein M0Q53_03875 [Prolixibacteraceae bacterium]|nr:hypothetical protein [Prolixibacteraceae bacterium]
MNKCTQKTKKGNGGTGKRGNGETEKRRNGETRNGETRNGETGKRRKEKNVKIGKCENCGCPILIFITIIRGLIVSYQTHDCAYTPKLPLSGAWS